MTCKITLKEESHEYRSAKDGASYKTLQSPVMVRFNIFTKLLEEAFLPAQM